MKYKLAIEIALEQDSLFDISIDRKSLVEWNSGYSAAELTSGIPGEAGATYTLTLDKKGNAIYVGETILSVTRPYEYISAYTMQGMTTTIISRCIKISENNTAFVAEVETKASNPITAFFLLLMLYPTKWVGANKLKKFKEFAEKNW